MTEGKPSWLSPAPPPQSLTTKRSAKKSVGGALRRFENFTPSQFDAYKPRTMGERVARRLFMIAVHGEVGEAKWAIGQICDRLMGRAAAAEVERLLPEAPVVQILQVHSVAPLPLAEGALEVDAQVVDVEPEPGQNGDEVVPS